MRKDDDRDPTQSLWSDACRKAGALGAFLQENFNLAREYFDSLRSRPDVSLSLVCPHLGCLMHWNDAENTWDCPCHGSRFDARGRLICGPVNQDLEPVREAAERRRRAPAPWRRPRRNEGMPTIQVKGERA